MIINFIIVFIDVSSTFHRPRVNEDLHNDYGGEYVDPHLQQHDDGDYDSNLYHLVPTTSESPSSQEINNNNNVNFHFSYQIAETSPLSNLDIGKIVSPEITINEEAQDIPSSPEHIKHILVSVAKGHDEEAQTFLNTSNTF